MKTALLIVDMINTMDFPEAKLLIKPAILAAHQIQRLKSKFRSAKMPIIYVNDNFGQWKEDWKSTHQACQASFGHPLAKLLSPDPSDYFILKPKHSGFYGTQLETLLKDLKVRRLVITGIAGNICVLFTVNDAHMRGFEIIVPRDAIASNSKRDNDYALRLFKTNFKIKTPNAARLRL